MAVVNTEITKNDDFRERRREVVSYFEVQIAKEFRILSEVRRYISMTGEFSNRQAREPKP